METIGNDADIIIRHTRNTIRKIRNELTDIHGLYILIIIIIWLVGAQNTVPLHLHRRVGLIDGKVEGGGKVG